MNRFKISMTVCVVLFGILGCGDNTAMRIKAIRELDNAFKEPQPVSRASELEYYARDILGWDLNTLIATGIKRTRFGTRASSNMPQVVYETPDAIAVNSSQCIQDCLGDFRWIGSPAIDLLITTCPGPTFYGARNNGNNVEMLAFYAWDKFITGEDACDVTGCQFKSGGTYTHSNPPYHLIDGLKQPFMNINPSGDLYIGAVVTPESGTDPDHLILWDNRPNDPPDNHVLPILHDWTINAGRVASGIYSDFFSGNAIVVTTAGQVVSINPNTGAQSTLCSVTLSGGTVKALYGYTMLSPALWLVVEETGSSVLYKYCQAGGGEITDLNVPSKKPTDLPTASMWHLGIDPVLRMLKINETTYHWFVYVTGINVSGSAEWQVKNLNTPGASYNAQDGCDISCTGKPSVQGQVMMGDLLTYKCGVPMFQSVNGGTIGSCNSNSIPTLANAETRGFMGIELNGKVVTVHYADIIDSRFSDPPSSVSSVVTPSNPGEELRKVPTDCGFIADPQSVALSPGVILPNIWWTVASGKTTSSVTPCVVNDNRMGAFAVNTSYDPP